MREATVCVPHVRTFRSRVPPASVSVALTVRCTTPSPFSPHCLYSPSFYFTILVTRVNLALIYLSLSSLNENQFSLVLFSFSPAPACRLFNVLHRVFFHVFFIGKRKKEEPPPPRHSSSFTFARPSLSNGLPLSTLIWREHFSSLFVERSETRQTARSSDSKEIKVAPKEIRYK